MKLFIPTTIEKRLTQHAKNVLDIAYQNAHTHNQPLRAEHILYAISKEDGSLGYTALRACGIRVSQHADEPEKNKVRLQTNQEVVKIIKSSMRIAMQYKQNFVGTEHILYGLTEKNIHISGLTDHRRQKLRTYLEECFSLNAISNASIELLKVPEVIAKIFASKKESGVQQQSYGSVRLRRGRQNQNASIFDQFCENLTEYAKQGTLDPLVGREEELDRMIRILIRRTKNNPLLIGEPGVGKTALVQGLAQRIENGEVPHALARKKLFSLNLNSLIAGTTFRGEFEERMHILVEEASANDVLLFIDEIHTIIGAGSAQGSMDAANIIKPALVKGDFQCIGATTFEEFKKSIEKDNALDRRFQKISIYEETATQSMQTLKKFAPLYEQHHNVAIPDDIIALCVDLSVQYIPHRSLPDKALDVLDEASSKVHAQNGNSSAGREIHTLRKHLALVTQGKNIAKEKDDFQEARNLLMQQEKIKHQIKQKEQEIVSQKVALDKNIIYEIIAEMASIPLESIQANAKKPLAESLKKEVVGQDKAIEKICYAIQRNKAGVRDTARPVGSFLFSGASGVGKTHLAKTLASYHTKTQSAFLQLDMSEFSESHSVSRLIGSPAGYVGYEDSGVLTKKVRQYPGAIILFDEIEKAHPNVLNLLLQILEYGILTDNQGRPAFFKNTIIILTTNIGAENNGAGLGFSRAKNQSSHIQNDLAKSIRKELINRIDEIIVFNELTQKDLTSIAENELHFLQKRIAGLVKFEYTKTVPVWIARVALQHDKGARAIRSIVQQHIEDKLASELTQNNPPRITARTQGKNIHIEAHL